VRKSGWSRVERVDQALIGLFLRRRDGDLAIGGAEHAIRRDDRVIVAAAIRRLSGRKIIRGEKSQYADHRIGEGGADGIPPPRAAAAHKRGTHSERTLEAGNQVGDRRPGPHWRPIRLAGYAHETAHRLGDEIEGGPVAIGSAVAEAGDVAIDEGRIQRLEP